MTLPSAAGQRRAHSSASSLDLTWIIQYPPTTSRASLEDPSVTVLLPPKKLTRAPFESGCRPSSASSAPARCSSALYLIIADMVLGSGFQFSSERFGII